MTSDYVPPKATTSALLVLFAALFALWLLWSGHYTVDFAALFTRAAAEEGHGASGHGADGHGADRGGHAAVNLLILALGLASCLGVTLLCRGMEIVDNETIPVHLGPRLLRYVPWLTWQVVLANVEVIRRILRLRTDGPETVVVEGHQRSDLGRATYANSITLTPGTVTIDVTGSTFTVHALTASSADSVLSGATDREVTRLEGPVSPPDPPRGGVVFPPGGDRGGPS